ncbi:fibronectin type III domain-containing protein [Patescibacteria group bacterium]|nr:fibronectin type III domain-containing protein [Patescibacteria group bacterium]
MRIKAIVVAGLFFLLSMFVRPVFALTKSSGDLEVTVDEPLFPPSVVWYPGLSVTKSFSAKNRGTSPHTLAVSAVHTTDENSLARFFFWNIAEAGTVLYGGGETTMADFWNAGAVTLASLPPGAAKTIDLTAGMDPAAGNGTQGSAAAFDLVIGFTGTGESVTVSGTGGGGGGGTAPVCNDAKPGSAPTLTSATGGTNSVGLTWTESSGPISYYLITYGTSPGAQIWGNTDIGGKGTTQYTIQGLSGGTTYYFKLRAGNGCMPGDYSNEVSATPGGGFIAGPATGFAAGVLGAQTETATPGGELRPTPTLGGQILGGQSAPGNPNSWQWLLHFAGALAGFGALSLAGFLLLLGLL